MKNDKPKEKFNDELVALLKTDERFVDDEGHLIKNVVIDKAWKLDDALITLLFKIVRIRNEFFKQIKGYCIFNVPLFVDFIMNKNFLGDSSSKFGKKIGLTIDGKHLKQRGEVALIWPSKDCILKGGMSNDDSEKDEVFFNEILAKDDIDRLLDPKVLTKGMRFSHKGEQPVGKLKQDESGVIRENLIIKGNNLLAMHSLKKKFAGKIKLIYIDPPYNTGGSKETFTYNNNFRHSTWLTFMKNRLEIAKQLLKDDGFIAIAIDHFELFYLGALADEIFGRENRLGIITVVHKREGRQFAKGVNPTNEFMLWYSKKSEFANLSNYPVDPQKLAEFDQEDECGKFRWENYIRLGGGDSSLRVEREENWYPVYVSSDLSEISLSKNKGWHKIFPITDSGVERTWNTSKSTLQKNLDNQDVKAEYEDGKLRIFRKIRASQMIKTNWEYWDDPNYNATRYGTQELNKIIGAGKFSYPKSIYAVIDTLKRMTSKDDIILDFFAGSGTTGHATWALNKEDGGNRTFILIEQLDQHIEICKERHQKLMTDMFKQGKTEFVYLELKKDHQKFIDRIQTAKTTAALEKIWEEMESTSLLNCDVDLKNKEAAFKEWAGMSSMQEKQKALITLLDKNQLYVNLSEIEDEDFCCTDDEKNLNKQFYGLDQ